MPRLDIPFKKGPIPKERGKIQTLRIYWQEFCSNLYQLYNQNGHDVRLLEIPLFLITVPEVRSLSKQADIIYIPHKMKENWFLDHRVRYYMQMVIPSIFSIDRSGWCASASSWPIQFDTSQDNKSIEIFDDLRNKALSNVSKFSQPQISEQEELPTKFILFPCQIPHDETIIYHSDVNVEQSLSALLSSLNYCSEYSILIKGHPANIQAMTSLKNIYNSYKAQLPSHLSKRIFWKDNLSIHQLLAKCCAVFTVNSGVGLEALLHYKKVFTFGNADYASCSTKIVFGGSLDNASQAVAYHLNNLKSDRDFEFEKSNCRRFINSWYNTHYDTQDPRTFAKLLQN